MTLFLWFLAALILGSSLTTAHSYSEEEETNNSSIWLHLDDNETTPDPPLSTTLTTPTTPTIVNVTWTTPMFNSPITTTVITTTTTTTMMNVTDIKSQLEGITSPSHSLINTTSTQSILDGAKIYSSGPLLTPTPTVPAGPVWPVKHAALIEGDVILGGLMMIHEREDSITCGPVMPQGGVQALEAMLYTLDQVNSPRHRLLPEVTFGAHILDDCDKDTYGLEMALDFIKGRCELSRKIFSV